MAQSLFSCHFRLCLVVMIFPLILEVRSQSCPQGWITRPGTYDCYSFRTDTKTWDQAREECGSFEADLVSIDRAGENEWIKSQLPSFVAEDYWTGLSDREGTLVYVWSDGSIYDPNLASWATNQPSHGKGTQACVAMSGSQRWGWVDAECLQNKAFICQKTLTDSIKCDEGNGWQYAFSNCYYTSSKWYYWDNAQEQCTKFDANLMDVENQEEQDFLSGLVQDAHQSLWIGYKTTSGADHFKWSSGKTVTYENWDVNEPKQDQPELCTLVEETGASTGNWTSSDCFMYKKFVCEKPSGMCYPGWRMHNGYCYQMVVNAQTTWVGAKQTCEAQGATLLTIRSETEQEFVNSMLPSLSQSGVENIWLGISDTIEDGKIQWANGDDYDPDAYKNWPAHHDPTNVPGESQCGSIYTDSSIGQWDYGDCFNMYDYACKIREGSPITPIDPDRPTGYCPADWYFYNDHCYYVNNTGVTYDDATMACTNHGAQLVSIHSAQEMSFIELRLGERDYYIGLHRAADGTMGDWADGTLFGYNNWDVGEPNNIGGNEDCVHLRGPYTAPSGVWNDVSCSSEYAFICEKPAAASTPPPPTNPPKLDCYEPFQPYYDKAQLTVDGDVCLYWADMTDRQYNPISYPNARLEENYCRNPNNGPTPWCYVEFGLKECDIPQCDAPTDCYEGDGYLYRGKASYTQNGSKCLSWATLDSSALYRPDKYPEEGLDENYCRNPSGATFGPWCYYKKNTFGYSLASCGLPQCKSTGCYDGSGANYRGVEDEAEDGTTCAMWDDAGSMPYNPTTYPNAGLDHNYCRNPSQDLEPWCYVWQGKNLVQKLCAVPHCSIEVGCYVGKGMSYRGKANYVTIGRTCSDWVDFIDEFYPVPLYEFSSLTNYAIRPISQSYTDVTLSECAHLCLTYDGDLCKSFNYYPGSKDDGTKPGCFLSHFSRSDGNMVPDPLEDYYERNMTYGLEENYCRNPDGRMAPWCYFYDHLHNQTNWAYCPVPECNPEDIGCYDPADDGKSYRGPARTTESGHVCLEWTDTFYTPDRYPNAGLEENFCRNPTSFRNAPFCVYQGTHGQTTAYCAIPQCVVVDMCGGKDWIVDPAEDFCYKIVTDTSMSQDDALDSCEADGGSLTSITSQAESSFLFGLIASLKVTGFWIGANDLYQEAGWEWMDGSPFAFLNWAPGQPDNLHGLEQCALMSTGNGQWTDEVCDLLFPHICKKRSLKELTTVAPTTEAPGARCPMDWEGFASHCYLVQKDFVSWQEAVGACNELDAVLATVHDDNEMKHIASMLTEASRQLYYFGANDIQKQDQWVYGNGTNDTPVSYTNWAEGQPDNFGADGEDCVCMLYSWDWQWNDANCESRYQVVCENENNGGDASFGRYTVHYDSMTFAEAQAHCVKYEGTMATMLNDKDKEDMATLLNRFYDPFYPDIFWLGVNDVKQEGRWVTGGDPNSNTVQTYTNWHPNEPNNYKSAGEHCGMMAPVNEDDLSDIQFEWYDWACANAERFICEDIDPDSHYYGSQGHLYSTVNEALTWQEASSYCQSKGGRLAQVRSAADQRTINYMLSDNREKLLSSKGAWIGLNDISHQMNFEWVDGSEVTYTNWNVGEPDDFTDTEDCVFAYSSSGKDSTGRKYYAGKWADYGCLEEEFGYVCEKPKGNFGPSEIPPPEYDCPIGWFGSDIYCYLLLEGQFTWEEARDECASNMNHGMPTNTTLVYVPNYNEDIVLSDALMVQTGLYWIGLRIDPSGDRGTYEWETGQPVTYTDWDSMQPGNLGHPCVAMQAGPDVWARWDDQSCDSKYSAICQKPRHEGWQPEIPPTPSPSASCPIGWEGFGSYCYLVVRQTNESSREDMYGAWNDCAYRTSEFSSQLLSLHSRQEEDFVKTLVRDIDPSVDPDEGFWTGMSAWSGYMYWNDGTYVQYVNWAPGMPEGIPEDDVLGLTVFPASDEGWTFVTSSARQSWICKTPKGAEIGTTLKPVSPGTSTRCGEGETWKDWQYNADLDTCYRFMGSDQTNRVKWTDALSGCLVQDANLVAIHSNAENKFVQQLVTENNIDTIWLGMYDIEATEGYKWADGSPADYFKWATHEPGSDVTAGVEMDAVTGGWKLAEFDTHLPYMCKKSPGVDNYTPAPTQRSDGFCPRGWFAWGNKCLQFRSEEETWMNHRNACREMGGDLVSIRDATEQAYIVTLLESVPASVWIGLNDIGHEGWFVWSDTTPVFYTNWVTNEPNNVDEEDCVHMYGSDSSVPGRWNDQDCSERLQALCSIPRDPNGTPVAPTLSLCGSYHHYGNSCYKLVNGSYTRDEAKRMCENDGLGSTLASINSLYEQKEVELMMSRAGFDSPAYIGLTYANNTYMWDDEWPVLYTNWDHGQPSLNPEETCVVIDHLSGRWDDVSCSARFPAVCKYTFDQKPYQPTLSPEDCPGPDWTLQGSACYKAYLDDEFLQKWFSAQYICSENHAHLVSIHSNQERDLVLSLTRGGFYSVWVGLNNIDNMGFAWDDSSPYEYNNWAPGEPSGKDGDQQDEQCTEMYTSGDSVGKWNDLYCAEDRPFVCKYTKDGGYRPRTTPLDQNNHGSGLGIGEIVGITIAGVASIVIIISLVIMLRRQKRMVAYFRSVAGLEVAPEELFNDERSGDDRRDDRDSRANSFDDAMLTINN